MLAALLLNLEAQTPSRVLPATPKKRRKEFLVRDKLKAWEAAQALSEALEEVEQSEPVKALKKLKPAIQKYAQDEVADYSDLLRQLSMREFELRQQVHQEDPTWVLVLESLVILKTYLEQDEEDVFVLLMSLP